MRRRILAFLAFALFAGRVGAIDIVVEGTAVYPAADGLCALVEAIDNANADLAVHGDCPAGSGADRITLSADVVLDGTTLYSADGPNGLPSIVSAIDIDGRGFAIERDDAAAAFRLLHVGVAGTLVLERTTVKGGAMADGFFNGGGLLNHGIVRLVGSTVSGNRVESIFPAGGGIYNQGELHVIDSRVAGNSAIDATFSHGGGIYSSAPGTLALNNAVIENNIANDGGGVWASPGVTGGEILASRFVGNAARDSGGAMLLFGGAPGDRMYVVNTRFESNSATEAGGAIATGIDELDVFGSTFTGNVAEGASGGGGVFSPGGGAIRSILGGVRVLASKFESNSARGTAFGGAIMSAGFGGEVHVVGSIVRGNSSESTGGGLFGAGTPFYVTDSLLEGNTAEFGGAIAAGATNVDTFRIERSSLVGNTASRLGGGFYALGASATNFLVNSTVSGNTAPDIGGGVMLNQGGRVEILHSAIIGNVSDVFVNSVGGLNAFAGTTEVGATIIADNLQVDCSATNGSTSLDYNITTGPSDIAITRWCSFIPIAPNDMVLTNPVLGPLASNGNLGPTYLPLAGSPAIDAIPTDCPPELAGVDQRGIAREPGSCDIGPVTGELVALPRVAFALASSTIDDEATAGPHIVELIVDNTNGSLAVPAMDLSLYVMVTGAATAGLDYASPGPVPAIYVFDALTWPAPGDSVVVPLEFSVLDDDLGEGDETIELTVSLTGPGVLGEQVSHRVTIVDDEIERVTCNGFYPPLHRPVTVQRLAKRTLPAKLALFGRDGLPLGAASIAPPRIVVNHDGITYGDAAVNDADLVPVGQSNQGNAMRYDGVISMWSYRVDTAQFPDAGHYEVNVVSGDPDSYSIDEDGNCRQIFQRK